MKTSIASFREGNFRWSRYLWLFLGAICALFAANGRWDLSLMAWLYPLFFLRFTRTSSPFVGIVGVWLASVVALFFFFYESEILVFNPIMIGGCLVINTILVLPYLVDRLVSPRLSLLSGLLATLVFPLSRAAFEFLNTILVSPFGSMFSLAYTQYGNLPLLQILSITGVYGVTFLIAWFASVGNWAWEQQFSWSGVHKGTLLYSGLLVLVLLGGSIRLTFFQPSAQTVRVAGISVSRSLNQEVRHNISNFETAQQLSQTDFAQLRSELAIIDGDLLTRSQSEARAGAKIVVWPEAGAVTLEEDEAALIERGQVLAQQEQIYLAMGYVVLQYNTPYLDALYNRTVLIDPQGQVVWTYDKARPVPGMEEFAPGDGIVPVVDTPYGRIANVICFDADFPDLMRQANGVDLMLVPSNDWQGIVPMHTHHTAFRAIENGYSVVRQTSNGLAATYDYQGHVLAASDYFVTDQQTMIAFIPVKGVQTIYEIVGDLFAWLCVAGMLFLSGWTVFLSFKPASASVTSVETQIPVEDAQEVEVKKESHLLG